jgi:hypothetical protein
MSTRTAVKADRKTTHLVVASQRRTPHHRVASPRKAGEKTGPSRSLDALAEPGSGHDFSRIRVYPEQGHQSGRTVSGVCPLGISIPAFCPFGGACHTCPSRVQAKLTVGRPDDKYEREADRVADAVMRMPEPRCPACDEEEFIQTKPLAAQITPLVQRQTEEEEEEEEEEKPVQTIQTSRNTARAVRGPATCVGSLKGGGEPLARTVRDFFEPRFGYDFSQVRVHGDAWAADSAEAIQARAFTSGRDIVFAPDQYSPDTRGGRRLLAHELTHIIQQANGIPHIQRDVTIHNAGCPLETLDHSRNSAQIGAMSGTPTAYGLTQLSTRTPGRKTVLGSMLGPNQGEIWVSSATIFPITASRMYLTNQFADGSCEHNWTFDHEMWHWLGGCDLFERRLALLRSDLEALPGPGNRQLVDGNQPAVEQARQNLEGRVDTILRCFRIEVCREISRFNHRLDSRDYPQAFSSCPPPRPQVPQVPPLATYLGTCNPPPAGCPRPIG